MATKRQLIHAQLLQAAQENTGVRQEYYLWAANIIGRKIRGKNKKQKKQDRQLKLL